MKVKLRISRQLKNKNPSILEKYYMILESETICDILFVKFKMKHDFQLGLDSACRVLWTSSETKAH